MVKTYCLFESMTPQAGQPDPPMDCRIRGSSVSCDKPGSHRCGQIEALGPVIRSAATILNPIKRRDLVEELNQTIVAPLQSAQTAAAGQVNILRNIADALAAARAIPRSVYPDPVIGGRRKTYRRKQKKNKTRRRR